MKLGRMWCVSTILVSSWTGTAFAIEPATVTKARRLTNDGVELFKGGAVEQARTKFLEAASLVEVPTIAKWLARTCVKQGRLSEAAGLYRRAAEMKPNELWVGQVQQQSQREAEAELAKLEPRIPTLTIELDGAVPLVIAGTIDGVPVAPDQILRPLRLDPGHHHIAMNFGPEQADEEVTLVEGEARVLRISVPEASPSRQSREVKSAPDPRIIARSVVSVSPRSTAKSSLQTQLMWASLGVGVAGATLGLVAGAVVWHKHSDLRDSGCTDSSCVGSSYMDRIDSYNRWRTISTVGFIVGAAGATAGVTLAYYRSKTSAAGANVTFGPGQLTVTGEF